MLASIRRDFHEAQMQKGDWPLLLLLAFVSLQLVTLILWGSPKIFSEAETVPAQALLGQIVLFVVCFCLALCLRIKQPSFKFWALTSVLISSYLIWLMVLRADLTFSLGSLVCLACLLWTNFAPQALRPSQPGSSPKNFAAAGPDLDRYSTGLYPLNAPPRLAPNLSRKRELALGLLLLGSALFIHLFFMGRLSLCRVWGLSTPSYDFGLFNQMFAYMKETGLPLTTLERDGLYSHFQVHFSPIYYLLLPLYALFPRPETLQIAQLLIVCSGLVPLLLLGRRFQLPFLLQAGVAAAYLLQPGLVLGSFYDLHENCFLAPLVCWLFWAIFQGKFWFSLLFALLLLLVKEDAALYLVSAGLFVFFSPLLSQQRYRVWPGLKKDSAPLGLVAEPPAGQPIPQPPRKGLSISASLLGLLLAALGFLGFLLISAFLEQSGEGLMSYRFDVLQQYGGAGLLGILRSIFQNPAQVLGLMLAAPKLSYLLTIALATGFLPFLQLSRSHYLLFLPLCVMNLATDYAYQYDIFFQYNFGSHSFLIIALLLAVIGLTGRWPVQAEPSKLCFKPQLTSAFAAILLAVAVLGSASLSLYYIQTQDYYVSKYLGDPEFYRAIRQDLEALPRDKVIGASTFATTFLADCPQLYDLKFHESVSTGNRDLDILVWAPNQAGDQISKDPWVSQVWKLYQSQGYIERPDLSANGLLKVLSRPDLTPTGLDPQDLPPQNLHPANLDFTGLEPQI